MHTIVELLEYLPKGSINLFFEKVGSLYYDCVKTQTLQRQDAQWREVVEDECFDKSLLDINDWVHMHGYDKVELSGRTEGNFITRIQNIEVHLSTDSLIKVIGKTTLEDLLTEIREWVFSVEGKEVLATFPHDASRRKGSSRWTVSEPL